jgi:hypothetical protein
MAKKEKSGVHQFLLTGKKAEAARKQEKQERRQDSNAFYRFHLKNGEDAEVTFVDTPKAYNWEHSAKIGKYFRNFTCIVEWDACAGCETGSNRSLTLAATIINHSTYVNKKGKKVKNRKQLIVFKGKARKHIEKIIARRGGDITHCRFLFSRGDSETECGTGEYFEYLKKVKEAKLLAMKPSDSRMTDEEWLSPINYHEALKPLTAKEMRQMLGQEEPDDLNDEEDEEDDEEEEEEKPKKKKAKKEKTSSKKKKKKPVEEDEEEDEEPEEDDDEEDEDWD